MTTELLRRNFQELFKRRRGDEFKAPPRVLCLDPGETTGYALFEHGTLTTAGQVRTIDDWKIISDLFEEMNPTHVVYENYRVYSHKLDRHAFSEVYTLRLIGVIEFLCDVVYRIPYCNQMAQQAKGFTTDEKLKHWGFYDKGPKHARDAMRHGVYYLLFNQELTTWEGGL